MISGRAATMRANHDWQTVIKTPKCNSSIASKSKKNYHAKKSPQRNPGISYNSKFMKLDIKQISFPLSSFLSPFNSTLPVTPLPSILLQGIKLINNYIKLK